MDEKTAISRQQAVFRPTSKDVKQAGQDQLPSAPGLARSENTGPCFTSV